MYPNLMASNIGIKDTPLPEVLKLAKAAGFQGVDVDMAEVVALTEQRGAGYVRDLFESSGMKPGSWWVPFNWWHPRHWDHDEASYKEVMARLPKLAEVSVGIGSAIPAVAVEPADFDRPYRENFEWHVEHFRPVAQIFKDAGSKLAIEFKGPKSLRVGLPHEFVHGISPLKELIAAIGTGNIGILVDAWHLWTGGGKMEEVRTLTKDDILAVHVNDAPAGIAMDDLQDLSRAMMLETGRIDVPEFLRGLAAIGYDGPVTPEPFSARVSALPAEKAVAETAAALRRCYEAAGLRWATK